MISGSERQKRKVGHYVRPCEIKSYNILKKRSQKITFPVSFRFLSGFALRSKRLLLPDRPILEHHYYGRSPLHRICSFFLLVDDEV